MEHNLQIIIILIINLKHGLLVIINCHSKLIQGDLIDKTGVKIFALLYENLLVLHLILIKLVNSVQIHSFQFAKVTLQSQYAILPQIKCNEIQIFDWVFQGGF